MSRDVVQGGAGRAEAAWIGLERRASIPGMTAVLAEARTKKRGQSGLATLSPQPDHALHGAQCRAPLTINN